MKNKVIAMPNETKNINDSREALDKRLTYDSLTMDLGSLKALDDFLEKLDSCQTENEKIDWLTNVNKYLMSNSQTIQNALSEIHRSRSISRINVHITIKYIEQNGWEVPNTPTISGNIADNHNTAISESVLNNIVTAFINDNHIRRISLFPEDLSTNGKGFNEIKTIAKQILIELSNGTNIDEDNLPAGFLAILTFRTTGKTGCGPWDGIARKPANHKNFTAEWEASGTGPMKGQIKTLPLSPETKAIVDEFMAGITAKLEMDETIRKFNEFIASNPSVAEELRLLAQQAREEGQSHPYPALASLKNLLNVSITNPKAQFISPEPIKAPSFLDKVAVRFANLFGVKANSERRYQFGDSSIGWNEANNNDTITPFENPDMNTVAKANLHEQQTRLDLTFDKEGRLSDESTHQYINDCRAGKLDEASFWINKPIKATIKDNDLKSPGWQQSGGKEFESIRESIYFASREAYAR